MSLVEIVAKRAPFRCRPIPPLLPLDPVLSVIGSDFPPGLSSYGWFFSSLSNLAGLFFFSLARIRGRDLVPPFLHGILGSCQPPQDSHLDCSRRETPSVQPSFPPFSIRDGTYEGLVFGSQI